MDYQEKYIKYKLKYLNLKSELSTEINGGGKRKKKSRKGYNAGRSNESYVAGINYEGGKIIEHIKKFKQCVAYANCQIAMDAPFHSVPRVADEKVRSSGRSESQFHGYNEDQLKDKLLEIFSHIRSKYSSIKIVIQIARGRSSEPTFVEVIKPVLDRLGLTNVVTKYGYRSTDYFVPTDETPFVFVNYGMFAELSDNIRVQVGEICNPVVTYDVLNYDNTTGFEFNNRQSFESDDMNILNNFDIKKLTLFGIADSMKFVTPAEYKKEHVLGMVDKV
jgi:hypothetical protein